MSAMNCHRRSPRVIKILVIDEDDTTAVAVARALQKERCEVIACRDMALAEAATDLAEFDLIIIAPRTTGIIGPEGLAAVEYLATQNPLAATALLLPRGDRELDHAAARIERARVLHKPLSPADVVALVRSVEAHHKGCVQP